MKNTNNRQWIINTVKAISFQVGKRHVVTIYGIDAVANEINVILKFFDLGMKIQIWSYLYKNVTNPVKIMLNK
jgi:hypothetical protein